ncbi:O-antigen ligase family protein [Candidatus Azambacteria bacterium]|nr:O-antigen ligase family protein [Candidatus Azambacteria bacterium]
MFKTELYLSKIIKYGLYAILLTPLVFWSKALYGFLTPKFLLFQVLAEIIFGAWLVLAIANPRYRPKFSWLTAALALFFAVSLVAALSGIDFNRSIWGIGARMTGFFAELHFLAWFLVLASIRESTPDFDIQKYLNFSFAVSAIAALSLFLQAGGVFNNPTFIAPYLAFHFFWGFYQFSINKLWLKAIWGIGSAFILFSVFFTGIRGAAIGFIAGLIFLAAALIFSRALSRRAKIATIVIFLIGILTAIGVWNFRESAFIKNIAFLKRLSDVALYNTTAQTRLLAWQTALNGFKDAPLIGVGPENFNFVFNAHYNPRFFKFGSGGFGETWFDKPHNAFLEILSETGVVGSLAYILIWLTVLAALIKMFKADRKLLSLILTSAFISYLGAVFFSFDSFGSWFGLYLFLAVLTASSDQEKKFFSRQLNLSEGAKKIVMFITALVVAYLILLNYSIWRANLADADALRTFSGNPTAGIALFNKSLNYKSPYKSEYQFDLIASVGGAIEKRIPINNLENTINFVLDEADKAVASHPNNAGSYTDMARIYNILGTLGRDSAILNQAKQFGEKSLELSPNRQETLFYLARTALLKNNPGLAVQLTKKAMDIDPAISASHWYLGLSYIANNQMKEGLMEIKKSLEMGYQLRSQTEKDFVKNLRL